MTELGLKHTGKGFAAKKKKLPAAAGGKSKEASPDAPPDRATDGKVESEFRPGTKKRKITGKSSETITVKKEKQKVEPRAAATKRRDATPDKGKKSLVEVMAAPELEMIKKKVKRAKQFEPRMRSLDFPEAASSLNENLDLDQMDETDDDFADLQYVMEQIG